MNSKARDFISRSNLKSKMWTKKELINLVKLYKLNIHKNLNKYDLYKYIKKALNIKKILSTDVKLNNIKDELKCYGYANCEMKGGKPQLYKKLDKIKKSIINRFISTHQQKGMRPYMEDQIQVSLKKNFCYLAVYDGHGGKECSNYLKKNLFKNFSSELKKNKSVRNSLQNSFIKTNKIFINKSKTEAGSTATVLFINFLEGKYYIANTGDSRIISYIGNKSTAMTIDHKPNSPLEKKRLLKFNKPDVIIGNRVCGILAVSRAFGDKNLAKYVIATPDITYGNLNKYFKFFVLASDGLYDVMSNDEICNFINKQEKNGVNKKDIAKYLVKHCIHNKKSGDNVSVVIIWLN